MVTSRKITSRKLSSGPNRLVGRASFVKKAETSRTTRAKRNRKVRSNRGYK